MAKTQTLTKAAALADRQWHVVDVAGLTLGRAASQIAHLLRGKHKPTFSPHVDGGDYVIVVNAGKIGMSGKKLDDKPYHRHTLFPGGLRTLSAAQMLAKKPVEPLKQAVYGMLPKGPLGRQIRKKLKIYAGAQHPHEAQQPAPLNLAAGRS